MRDLEGRVAVVTGAASGIGRALAVRDAGIGVSVLCPALVRTPMTAQFGEAGLAPEVVAGHVVEAIREERFYVLTHPEWLDAVRARCAGIVEGTAPQAPAPSP